MTSVAKPSHDPDVEHEPHLGGAANAKRPDLSEHVAERDLANEHRARGSEDAAMHSMHDEPAIFPAEHDRPRRIDRDWFCSGCGYNRRGLLQNAPCPECGQLDHTAPAPLDKPGYASWLTGKMRQTTEARSWLTVLWIAVIGGPWAILGALLAGGGPLVLVVFGPAAEEVMKLAAAAVVAETRPYLFKRPSQIVIAAVAGAFVFACIENLLYLRVYVPNPPVALVLYRWTACVALHVGCTAVASVGLVRVWKRVTTELRRPRVSIELYWLALAIGIHGIYNATAYTLEYLGVLF